MKKKKKKKRNLNIISQFITDSLRQYPFMCALEDKYAFNQVLYCYYYHDYCLVCKASHILNTKKGVKKYDVRVDNKYFSLLQQHSIIPHFSYQCYENVSIN